MENIITELNNLMPQLNDFLNQFHRVVSDTGINVVTDSIGNMSIDVPSSMPDAEAESISKRIGILDRLINFQGQKINSVIQEGLKLEAEIKTSKPEYTSHLSTYIEEFKRLNSSYIH